MHHTRIRKAMDLGKRWAGQQLQQGVEPTPETIEQAAQDQFEHRGLRHLFITSALEVLLEAEVPSELPSEQRYRAAS